jgi:tryptophan synthase alpha chain
MNSLDQALAQARTQKRAAFIPFLSAGDPDLDFTIEALKVLAEAGATAIEVGFPFSDPIADGPVIQAAYTRALNNGFKIDPLFERIKTLTSSAGWTTPILGMASFTLIWRKGPEAFIAAAKAAGFSGVVVPDMPVEEAEEFAKLCQAVDFKLILLVTPTTANDRAEAIVRVCSGFVYVVSVVGITGARSNLSADLPNLLKRLKEKTQLPLCVGFGVSTPDHVKNLKPIADGVIVGSALVKVMENAATDRKQALANLTNLAKSLAQACV